LFLTLVGHSHKISCGYNSCYHTIYSWHLLYLDSESAGCNPRPQYVGFIGLPTGVNLQLATCNSQLATGRLVISMWSLRVHVMRSNACRNFAFLQHPKSNSFQSSVVDIAFFRIEKSFQKLFSLNKYYTLFFITVILIYKFK